MKKILLITLCLLCITNSKAQDKTITSAGDILQMALPAVAFGSTFLYKDDHTKPTWQFIKAYGSSVILEQALKHIVQKPRPDGSDNLSFPSGHTTSAFSGAAFIQRRYGWKYGIPSYILASFVGYSRIQAKKHDGWDVLAGATIGIGTSYLFTKPYEKNKINVSLNKVDKGYTIGFNYSF
ncbi:phosphatase PAP2 family protein [Flavobacterium aciduliphilum]|uniref:PAP2 superfamily protein n=1 Tax=Flavobacterium aciduliphilum TaxID=1101402 RepID=A0A328YQ61_9FLAO|nr:phosphatase PAP2 family protein [Flavobacterium aciduliphilum]RAR75494.1 PAP2 superfamily protein [Flavobacterium aciduliphilum]